MANKPRQKSKPVEDSLSSLEPETKVEKYVINKKKGMSKKQAAIVAGYADGQHTAQIERTQEYSVVMRKYADVLTEHISMAEVAQALAENIRQDNDRGARNTAIKMAYDKWEPHERDDDDSEKVVIVLR